MASTSRARVWHRKFRSASTSIPGPNAPSRSRAKLCSPDGVRAERGPDQRPGPRLRRGNPADLRERPIPRGVRRPPENRGVRLSCPARRWSSRPPTSPAARSRTPPPRRPPRPGPRHARTACAAGRHPACPAPATARRCSAAATGGPPGIDPPVRVQLPGQQVLPAPPVIQAIRQLGHHLPYPQFRPRNSRNASTKYTMGRQRPPALLPRPRRLDDPIHQVRREHPGQHAYRDPVGQPAIRRQTLSTIMSHKTITLSHHRLRQGHWGWPSRSGRQPRPRPSKATRTRDRRAG